MCPVASCVTSQVIAYLASKLWMSPASLAAKPEEDLRKVAPRYLASGSWNTIQWFLCAVTMPASFAASAAVGRAFAGVLQHCTFAALYIALLEPDQNP